MEIFNKIILDNNLADYASILGLLITVIGFVFILINVIRSKNASMEAEKIARQVRDDFSKFDLVSLISTTITVMEEIRRLHRQAAWDILPDRYTSIKKALISLKSTTIDLSVDQKKVIQSAITNFSSIEKQVESAIFNKTHPENVDKINTLISKQIDLLQEIFIEIRNKIGK